MYLPIDTQSETLLYVFGRIDTDGTRLTRNPTTGDWSAANTAHALPLPSAASGVFADWRALNQPPDVVDGDCLILLTTSNGTDPTGIAQVIPAWSSWESSAASRLRAVTW